MKKIKVGYDFKVPEEYKDCEALDVGGYKVISVPDKGILVHGKRTLSTYLEKIGYTSIMPCTKEKLSDGEDEEKSIYETFELNDDTIYYHVTYNDYAYIFDDRLCAMDMLFILVDTKASALELAVRRTKK